MSRPLSPNVAAEAKKEANRPVELYAIYLDEETLHLAAHDQNVQFFNEDGTPTLYYASGIRRSSIRTNVESRVDECSVSIDNVTREMSAYMAHHEFRGCRLKIVKVFLDHLGDFANHVIIFDGVMDAPVANQHAMTVSVTSRLDTLNVSVPRRHYQRLCNWKFGGPECGVNLASVTVTGTVSGVSNQGRKLTLSGRFESAGYFEDGILTIDGLSRKVVASSGSTIDVEYSFPEDVVGKPYTMRRGCNKDYDTGCARFSNQARFGGFLSVPSEKDVRE